MPTTIKETPWVDAAIRYTHLQQSNNDDTTVVEEEVDEDDLPSPTECYTFIYPNPNNNDDGCDNDIKVEIKGFHDDSEQTWNSTGLTLWRSSHYLCQYLLSEGYKTLQKDNHIKVLELGSGLGRCGILSHQLSHENTRTILTDGDTDVLKLLRMNIENNTKAKDDSISCQQLLWGKEHATTFLSQQPEGRKFDIILGSDLIYVNSVIKPLFESVRILLRDAKDCKFIMAHCSRRKGNEVDLSSVYKVADEFGFDKEILLEDSEDISIFAFTFKDRSK